MAYSNLRHMCAFAAATMLALMLLDDDAGAQQVSTASVQPYVWKNVVIRGGGFVDGIVFSTNRKGLVYARTDVGGAYRSDTAGEHWTPLTRLHRSQELQLYRNPTSQVSYNRPSRKRVRNRTNRLSSSAHLSREREP